ncbi:MAG: FAD-binding oxidoreductase [Pelagimonas sp.]|nr:FAD-binding oxidoreductase [Pelagimonas sp.]
MNRIYEAGAYGPQGACFWRDTVSPADWPKLSGPHQADVAIVGGGFTGLNAALHLAQSGVNVAVIDAEHPGWGASGRNGGFCCLGGAKAPDALLNKRFGAGAAQDWADLERLAVQHVDGLISQNHWDVDHHSRGETLLAHTARKWAGMQADAVALAETYKVTPQLVPRDALQAEGLGGPWHGAMTLPIGFALNPRKYHSHLAQAVHGAGGRLFAYSPVTGIERSNGWVLHSPKGAITADQVIIATNGYSSENLPDWLRARYLPVQSSVIVTRPLSDHEQQAQGWFSDQMAYDTRQLLHYFRKLPDGRFLFGMRGGLRATRCENRSIAKRIRQNFARLFPAWKDVEITHEWSGLVCMMAGLTPFVGEVPGHNGLFAALGYHGNGVAMGSYAGKRLAQHIVGQDRLPELLTTPPRRFPLGRHRRHLLRPAYMVAELFDL